MSKVMLNGLALTGFAVNAPNSLCLWLKTYVGLQTFKFSLWQADTPQQVC